MLKINLGIYAALLLFISYLLVSKGNLKDTLINTEKDLAKVTAEKENLQTVISLKEDIKRIMDEYGSTVANNQKTWLEQQAELAKVNQEVINDVKNYMENPVTAGNTTDVHWVQSYNRSTERLLETGAIRSNEISK